MQIETIHTKPSGAARGTVVLLHGVCFGAWYWENNFQPWFTEVGFEVIAMSYRNHGNSEQKGSLKWRSIREYVEDVHQVVSGLEGPIYLIGHSMGGFILQHYLQKYPSAQLRKAALLCTVPASGIGGATLQVLKTYPFSFLKALITLSFKPVFKNYIKAKRLLFAAHTPDAELEPVVARMQDESFRAYLDMMFLDLPVAKSTGVPMLLIGGASDFLIRPATLKKNASQLQAAWALLNGAHTINREAGWEQVAAEIDRFFSET